jgi:uncharacterized membrane protein
MITDLTPDNLNKSQIERDNIQKIINSMSLQERTLCVNMIRSLQVSLADPKTGQTFMMAVAFANVDMACMLIEAGIVNATGTGPGHVTPFEKKIE